MTSTTSAPRPANRWTVGVLTNIRPASSGGGGSNTTGVGQVYPTGY